MNNFCRGDKPDAPELSFSKARETLHFGFFFFLLISVAFFFFHSMFWNLMLQDSSGVKNLIAFEGLNIYMCI